MRSLHGTLLLLALHVGVSASVCLTVLLAEAGASRLHPIDGVWRAEFIADSVHDDRQPIARGTLLFGTEEYSGLSGDVRLWATDFQGSHLLRFQSMTGEDGADDGTVSASRVGRDSVFLSLGQCSDCGAIGGRARIVADTIAGSWHTSSWGRGTRGTFRLVRVASVPPRP